MMGCESQPGTEASAGQLAFIDRLGVDTMSVEVYTRTAEGFSGDLLVRSPVTRVAHYEAVLAADGTIQRLEVEWRTPETNPEGPPPTGFTVTIEGDSATIETRGGRAPGTSRIAVPAGAIPSVGTTPLSYAELEQAVRQAMAEGGGEYAVSLIQASRGRVVGNVVKMIGSDTVSIDFFGSPMLAAVDRTGHPLWRSGAQTTLKIEGEATEYIDFEALAADFAARDARGEGMGRASPEATVESSVGGAKISVTYSRPAKRGREIWGGLVPYGEVWRTGANAATRFSSDRELEICGAPVPAGEYTLYSIYTAESAQLIINRQTGQWGTEYHPEQDLVRVEMERETLPEAVERFTIAVAPAEAGGVIQLSWDTTRFRCPLVVR
jgi:hypothetical protein